MSWPEVSIGSVCELVNGRAFKPSDWTREGLPIVRIQNLNNEAAPFNRFNGTVRDRFLIDSGALLFSWSGTPGTSFGAFFWNRGPAVLNQHIFNVILRENIDARYFRYALNARLHRIIAQAHGGVGLQHITKDKLEATTVPLPPPTEQRRIADILDKADAIRRKRKEAIALTEELLRSAFLEMFGDPVTNPKGWPVGLLGDTFSDDPRIGTLVPAADQPGLLVVRVGELGNYDVALDQCKRAVLSLAERERYLLAKGDVILARAIGSEDHLGKASVFQGAEEAVVFDSHVMRLRFRNAALDPYFFVQWLRSAGGRTRFMREAGRTAVQFNVNGKQITRVSIPLPPLKKQSRFRFPTASEFGWAS